MFNAFIVFYRPILIYLYTDEENLSHHNRSHPAFIAGAYILSDIMDTKCQGYKGQTGGRQYSPGGLLCRIHTYSGKEHPDAIGKEK